MPDVFANVTQALAEMVDVIVRILDTRAAMSSEQTLSREFAMSWIDRGTDALAQADIVRRCDNVGPSVVPIES